MKLTKFCAFSAAVLAASLAFADADDVRISFSTVGPDCYADGTTQVVDGEWYALIWQAAEDTVVDIDTTLQAVNPDECEVMLAAPLASGHRCPPVLFEVDSADAKKTGIYKVYLLDTRGKDGVPSGDGASANGLRIPVRVNGIAATSAQAAAGSTSIKVRNSTATTVFAATNVGNIAKPRISKFEPVGDKVWITVTGMVPSVNYAITKGATLKDMETTTVVLDADDNELAIEVDKDEANFFSVGRADMAK